MTPLARSQNFAARMGRWSARHRKTAIFGWLAFIAVAFALGSVVGTQKLDDDDMAVGDSGRAQQITDRGGFPDAASEAVILQSESSSAEDPAFQAAIRELVVRVSAVEGVQNVRAPLGGENGDLISKDGRSALVQFDVEGDGDGEHGEIEPVLTAVADVQKAHPELVVEQFCDASAAKALDETIEKDFQRAEFAALPITLGILVVVFGALVAAGIPLLLGLSAVMATIALIAIPSQWFPMDDASSSIILLIGLAVGVDYSLFYLKRARRSAPPGRVTRQRSRPLRQRPDAPFSSQG